MANQVIQEIKDRLNIAEVLGGYIQLKKAGGNFKALCPFHSEKTSSLQVSPSKQIWHCFGCGEGGDVISFVQKIENLEFPETLKLLAERAGIELPQFQPQDQKQEDEKDLLFRINDFAARFYHQILISNPRGKEALEYLKTRGLNETGIAKWQIGFAPPEFHLLESALQKKGVSLMDMVKSGVAIKNEKGQFYDRFRGRITFPIFNQFNKVVGFSARILPKLDDGKTGKYINSPETLIYNKSQVLFGLNFAKSEIRKKDECIIVEGQMDVISAHQAGFTNVVASSGTALTEQQLNLLSRFTRNLKFCFDADAAGLSATRRAIEAYLGKDFTIKIIALFGAKDPDELINTNKEEFARQVKEAPLFLDYYFNKAFLNFQSQSIEQKKNIAKDLLFLLKFLIDPIELDHYIRILAEKLGTSEKTLRDKISMLKQKDKPVPKAGGLPAEKRMDSRIVLEKEVLGGMLLYPEILEFVLSKGVIGDFENYEIRKIVDEILENAKGPNKPLGGQGQAGAEAVLPELKNKETGLENSSVAKEAQFMVELLLQQHEGSAEGLKRQLIKSFASLRLFAIKKQLHDIQANMKRLENAGEKGQLNILNQKFAELSNLRMEFERLI